MWEMQAAQGIHNIANGIRSYKLQKMQYKYAKKVQEYNNKMLRISDAQNQNVITTNVISALQNNALQAFNDKRSSILASGAATVAAATAGVEGNSVNMTMFDIQRNGAVAEYSRAVELDRTLTHFDNQRQQSAMQAQNQQDFSYIPKPQLSTALAGIATTAMQDYNKMQSSPGGGPDLSKLVSF